MRGSERRRAPGLGFYSMQKGIHCWAGAEVSHEVAHVLKGRCGHLSVSRVAIRRPSRRPSSKVAIHVGYDRPAGQCGGNRIIVENGQALILF